jgi:hypothetical protein
MKSPQASVRDSVWDSVWDSVRDSVRDSVWASVRDSVGDSVRASVRDSVWDSVWDSVRDSVRDSVWASVRDSVGDSVWASVWDSVWDSVWASVRDSVGDSVRASVRDSVGDSVRASVRDSVRDSVWASVGDSVGDSVWASVRDSVWDSVWDSVRDSVGDSVRDSVGDSVRASVRDSVYGQHDAGWLVCYRYFHDVLELRAQTQRLDGLWEFSQSAGWAIPCRSICFIAERHNSLSRDERGRLHGENGPALTYPDGWSIYAIHGTRVTADLIERPETITIEAIDAERNTEIKRIMINRYKSGAPISGAAAYLLDGNAEVLDRDVDYGTLYRKHRSGDTDLVMVHVVNNTTEPDGTVREFFLRVHPELKPMTSAGVVGTRQKMTARNAVASTWGMRGEDFSPEART